MPRAKGGYKTRRRHKKTLERAKGFYQGRSKLFTVAKEAVDHALLHAFSDRRVKKREFRSLWIVRINAAARAAGITYGQFMNGLKKAGVEMDRRAIAHLAYHDIEAFKTLAEKAKTQLAA